MIWYFFIMAITLLILVGVHEWGHYKAARICGVRVLKFSIGFGPVLFSWRNKENTEFALSLIPLGGFVSMLGEQDQNVDESQWHETYSSKTPWQRIFILFAGPAMNLIFAVFAYALIFLNGQTVIKPVVDQIIPNSPAYELGIEGPLTITEVDGQSVNGMQSVTMALIERIGSTGSVEIGYQNDLAQNKTAQLPITRFLLDDQEQQPLHQLGFKQTVENENSMTVALVVEGSAAERGGIQVGDILYRSEALIFTGQRQWVEFVQAHPGKPFELTVLRDGLETNLSVTPDVKGWFFNLLGQKGFLGVAPQSPKLLPNRIVEVEYSVIESIAKALNQTRQFITVNVKSFYLLLTGQLDLRNLGGPVSIGQIAGDSASYGVLSFLTTLAMLSIGLGVINLLPIPVLDGGHILFCFVELIRKKAVSEQSKIIAQNIGLLLVLSFMALAIFNDFARIL